MDKFAKEEGEIDRTLGEFKGIQGRDLPPNLHTFLRQCKSKKEERNAR